MASLAEALTHSYINNTRFVLLLCLMIGFSAWWAYVPTEVEWFKVCCLKSTHMDVLKGFIVSKQQLLKELFVTDTFIQEIQEETLREEAIKSVLQEQRFDPLNKLPELQEGQNIYIIYINLIIGV